MAEYNTILGFKVDLKQLSNLEKQLEGIQKQLEEVSTEFKDVAKDANKASGDMASGFSKLSNIIKGAGIIYGLTKIGQGLGYIIQQSINAEKEMASLESVIKSTGGVAGFTAQEIDKLSTHLSGSSIFSAGEINEAAARLLTYTDIVGEEVPRAMQNIIDWAARYNVSLVQAAETVGKAIQKPSDAAAALSRQGFKFTDEFIKKLKELERAGKLAEAQSLMFEQIEEGTKGAAEALRNTLGGALTGLKNTLDDVLTGDSGSFKGATQAINDLTTLLNDQSTKDAFNVLIEGFAGVVEWATKATVAIVEFFSKSNNGLQVGFNSLIGRAIGYNTNSNDYKQIVSDIQDSEKVIAAIEEGRASSGFRSLSARKQELETLKQQKSFLESIGLDSSGNKSTYTPPAGLAALSAGNQGSSAGTLSKEQIAAAERARKEYEKILKRFKESAETIKNQGVIDTINQTFLDNNDSLESGPQQIFNSIASVAQKMGATITGATETVGEMGVKLEYNLNAFAKANNLSATQTAELQKHLDIAIAEEQINARNAIKDEAINKLVRERIEGQRSIDELAKENEIRSNNIFLNEYELNKLLKDNVFQNQQNAEYEKNKALYGEEYAQKIRDQNQALRDQATAQEDNSEKIKKQKEAADNFASAVTGTIGTAFDQLWEGQSVKFGDLLLDLTKQLAKSMLLKYLANGIGGGGWGWSSFMSANGFADGGAFNKGTQFFATGGIVNRATPFGMAGGGMGVMGEAGPEAILPLTRGSNGKLGVQMEGGSGVNVVIGAGAVVVNATNDSKSDTEATAQAIKTLIDTRVNQIIKDSMRTGNILNRTRSGNY